MLQQKEIKSYVYSTLRFRVTECVGELMLSHCRLSHIQRVFSTTQNTNKSNSPREANDGGTIIVCIEQLCHFLSLKSSSESREKLATMQSDEDDYHAGFLPLL
jgi:hypothetical protein